MKYSIKIILSLLLNSIAVAGVKAQSDQVVLSTDAKRMITNRLKEDTAGIRLLISNNKHLMRTDPDSGLLLFAGILRSSRRLNYDYGIGTSLIALSMMSENKGLHEDAIQQASEALGYSGKTAEGKQELALGYNSMAIAYNSLGDLRKSVAYYYKTVEAIEQHKGSKLSLAMVYNNLSGIMQDKELSFRYLQKADSLARRQENKETLGLVLLNKAIIYNKYKEWDKSRLYLEEAWALGCSTDQKLLQHRALMRLGNYYLYREDPAKALQYLLEAQKIARDSKESALQQNAAQYLTGLVYYKLKEYQKAEQYLLVALAEAQRRKHTEIIASVQNALSYNYRAQGHYREAMDYHISWVATKDSMQNEAISRNIHNLEVKYRLSEKDREITGNKLLIAHQRQKIVQKNTWIIISVSGSIVLLTLGIGYYRNYRHKQGLQLQQITLLEREREIDMLKGIMKGEEKERGRLARELHDGIGGMLTTAHLSLNQVKKEQDEAAKEKGLGKLQNMIKDIASEVRKTAHNLMPDILIHHGLEDALLLYCSNMHTEGGLKVEIRTIGNFQLLEKSTELLLYRIAQELIQNVMKHAQAGYAILQIVQREHQISLSIEDDGQGFDTEQDNKGFGLQNLRYRIHALQGYLSVKSEQGRGTTVYVEFDLDKLAAVS